MAELKALIQKRGAIKSQLTAFHNFIAKVDQSTLCDTMIKNLELRIKNIEPILDNFTEVQNIIDELETDLDKNIKEREEFQDRYFEYLAFVNNIIDTYNANKKISISPINVNSQESTNHIRLPKIHVPIFDGTVTKWKEFTDNFRAMVHNNKDLSPCHKLCYLKASLKGEPSNMIRALEITDANYTIALETLNKRYNNKRKIINNHINALLNIENVTKESHTKLREFIDNIQTNIQCLQSLGQQIQYWDAILVPIMLNKLDLRTIQEWEKHLNDDDEPNEKIPSYNELIEFLHKRQNALEAVSSMKNTTLIEKTEHKQRSVKAFASTNNTQTTSFKCPICPNQYHFLQNCDELLKLSPSDRFEKVKEMKVCTNCLRKGHFVSDCKSNYNCRDCKRRHHSILHLPENKGKTFYNKSQGPKPKENDTADNFSQSQTTSSFSSIIKNNCEILLSTVIVNITTPSGQTKSVRCLLDSGSQSNFISEDTCKLLNLKLTPTKMSVTGITHGTSNIKYEVNLTISSRCNNFKTELNCFVLPTIAKSLPSKTISKSLFYIPPSIRLADPGFNESQHIDILIGANLFWSILCVGQIKNDNGTILHKTKFGWIISGELYNKTNNNKTSNNNTVSCLSLNSLHEELQTFWKVDEFLETKKNFTPSEQYCENHFKETTTRDSNGKFIVKIPLKENIFDLGNSFDIAKNRFVKLEKKFEKNPEMKKLYVDCINDYRSQNHLSKSNFNTENSFFLPHHAVLKETRETTKLRIVFDGSCEPNYGLSINQLQFTGPTIQQDIFSIIIRFRTYKYVLTGDIAQMYRQVWVHQDDRKYQKILWRENPNDPLECFELNTVTFGMTSAPYLAIKCLFELANLNEQSFPMESNIIKNSFYVDDVLTGSNSIDNLKTIKQNLINILKQGGFNLTKFKSNVPDLSGNNLQNQIVSLPNEMNKALGVFWNPTSDNFSFFYSVSDNYNNVTKRSILSNTARLFDPIGLLAPIIVLAKLIIQELWQINLKWDETIPTNLYSRWINLQEGLKTEGEISISRYILVTKANITEFDIPEQRKYFIQSFITIKFQETINTNNYSNLTKLKRIFAWNLRFVHNFKYKKKKI